MLPLRHMKCVLLTLLLLGCGSSAQTVLSLRDIDCGSCGTNAQDALARRDGVEQTRFDRPRAELTVRYDPKKVQPPELAAIAGKAAGVRVLVGAGEGTYQTSTEWPKGSDLLEIRDADATLAPVAGKVTVFDFYAKWCGPCRQVDAALREAVVASAPIAVRKVDIGDWDHPMAKAHMKGIAELPYVKVYGANGALVDTIVGLDLERVRAAIKKGQVAR